LKASRKDHFAEFGNSNALSADNFTKRVFSVAAVEFAVETIFNSE